MTRPYDADTIPPYEELATRAPVTVPTAAIRPTQPVLIIDRLLALHRGEPAEGPDPCVHLVDVDGALYVHNGHHRWIRALLAGEPTVDARLCHVRPQADAWLDR